MDTSQRRRNIAQFSLVGISHVAIFCLLYLFIIRPIHIEIISSWIIPWLHNINLDPDIIILSLQDDYWIESVSDRFQDVFLNLPFNGYFWLACTFMIAYKKVTLFRFVFGYNLLLFIIHPILIFLLFEGNEWISPLLRTHEMVYKGIFLSLGVVAIASGYKDNISHQ